MIYEKIRPFQLHNLLDSLWSVRNSDWCRRDFTRCFRRCSGGHFRHLPSSHGGFNTSQSRTPQILAHLSPAGHWMVSRFSSLCQRHLCRPRCFRHGYHLVVYRSDCRNDSVPVPRGRQERALPFFLGQFCFLRCCPVRWPLLFQQGSADHSHPKFLVV